MKVGIVGLPQVGKSTVFNMLTRGHVQTSPWGARGDAHVGIAQVPDPRVDRLARVFHPNKSTYATIEYVDLPGLAPGEGKAAAEGETREMAAYLAGLKNVDALLHVVRAFEDPRVSHVPGGLDPARDIGLFELEMIFSDLAIVEKRLERLARDLKKVKNADLELENSALQKFKAALEREHPLRCLTLGPEEDRQTRGFTFLSAKPILHVLNLAEQDAPKISNVVDAFQLREVASLPKVQVTAVCGKIEAEIADLPDEDARLFMDDLGLKSSGLIRIVQATHSLLGLLSFYTVSEQEVRAWTIPNNTTALQAAGVVHSDFERGFIKAEVVAFSDMVEQGSFQAARNKGILRLEGKEYVVCDGDVIFFRFHL